MKIMSRWLVMFCSAVLSLGAGFAAAQSVDARKTQQEIENVTSCAGLKEFGDRRRPEVDDWVAAARTRLKCDRAPVIPQRKPDAVHHVDQPQQLPPPPPRPAVSGVASAYGNNKSQLMVGNTPVALVNIIGCYPGSRRTLLDLVGSQKVQCVPFGDGYRCAVNGKDLALSAIQSGVAQSTGAAEYYNANAEYQRTKPANEQCNQ